MICLVGLGRFPPIISSMATDLAGGACDNQQQQQGKLILTNTFGQEAERLKIEAETRNEEMERSLEN